MTLLFWRNTGDELDSPLVLGFHPLQNGRGIPLLVVSPVHLLMTFMAHQQQILYVVESASMYVAITPWPTATESVNVRLLRDVQLFLGD